MTVKAESLRFFNWIGGIDWQNRQDKIVKLGLIG